LDWCAGPGEGSQKNVRLVTSPQRNPKRKKIFSILTRRLAESVDALNSSLALAAGDLWPQKCWPLQWRARALKGVLKVMYHEYHKRATWGFRGCGRIPNAAKLAIKFSKFGQSIQLHSHVSEVVSIFQTEAK